MRMPMSVWFDRPANFQALGSADPCGDGEDLAGQDESLDRLLSTLTQVHSSFQHVFIGGFSMGGCLALHVLRRYDAFQAACAGKLRGVCSMGSFIPTACATITRLPKLAAAGGSGGKRIPIPVLMLHGEDDTRIRCEWGNDAATALLLGGIDVRFQKYTLLDHEMSEDQLRDILNWMLDTELHGQADAAMSLDESSAAVDELKAAGADSHKLNPSLVKQGQFKDPGYSTLLQKETDMDKRRLGDKAEKGKQGYAEGAATAAGGAGTRPYTLEQSDSVANEWCIHYPASESAVPMLVTRPVLACGGVFDVCPDDGFSINGGGGQAGKRNGVYCIASTTDPERIATEIGKRLAVRIDSKGESVNACPMA